MGKVVRDSECQLSIFFASHSPILSHFVFLSCPPRFIDWLLILPFDVDIFEISHMAVVVLDAVVVYTVRPPQLRRDNLKQTIRYVPNVSTFRDFPHNDPSILFKRFKWLSLSFCCLSNRWEGQLAGSLHICLPVIKQRENFRPLDDDNGNRDVRDLHVGGSKRVKKVHCSYNQRARASRKVRG